MTYVKMLGTAAVAAVILMALVGVGTASATVLCKNNESASYCGEPYRVETEITSTLAAETKAKLKAEFKTVECSESTLSGVTETFGGESESVKGPVNTLTFAGCNCSISVLKKGTLEVHWISGGNNGTVTENGAEVSVTCSTIFGTVHCLYVTENTDLGTLTGGNPANLDVSASIPKLTTNELCSKATWEATYKVSKPSPLYVTSLAGLVLSPDPVKFTGTGKNNKQAITVANPPAGGTDIKNLQITSSSKELIPDGKCNGFRASGNVCMEFVECTKVGATGMLEATSAASPKLYVESKMVC